MNDLKNIIELEKSITDMLQDLKMKIAYKIEHTPLNNVRVISSNIVVLKLSELQQNIWTSEYYMPSIQAKYVTQYLENAVTAHAFTKKIKDMITNKSVKINNNTHLLNDTTIEILQKYCGTYQADC